MRTVLVVIVALTLVCFGGMTAWASPALLDSSFYGGAGDQLVGWGGAPIAVGGNGLYTCGYGLWSGVGYPSIGLHYGLPSGQQPVWSRYWPSATSTSLGYEVFSGVTATDEGVYFGGYSYQTSDGVGDKEDKSVLIKYDLNGSYQWAAKPNFYSYRGGESFNAVTNAVEPIIGRVVYAGGHAQANGVNFTALVAKYDAAGNMLWWRPVGDTSGYHQNSVMGIATLGDNVYAAGPDNWTRRTWDPTGVISFSHAKLWKCTPSGTSVNIATYSAAPALAYGQSIATQGNSIYVAGHVVPGPNGGFDALILKYDESGNLLWHKEWGGSGDEQASGIAADSTGVYVVGHTTSFGAGGEDAFLIVLDPLTGGVTSSTFYGGAYNDRARGCVLAGSELYVSGSSKSFSYGGNIIGQDDMMLLRYALANMADQTITFDAVDEKTFGDADFTVSATASSGLPVTFTASGDCTVTPTGTVHITGAGSGMITAHQAGDANYNAATDVPQIFTISKAEATVTVNGYTGVYDGAAHGATGTATGVNGEDLSSLLDLGAKFTDIPGGTANWIFAGDVNHNPVSGSVNIAITFKGNSGILQPVNQDYSSVFKQGSTIPLKFKVYDNNNMSVGPLPNVVSSFNLNVWSNGTVSDVNEPTNSTTSDTAFRWSSTDQQWIFNLSTKSLVKGNTYQGTITLIDGSTIIFRFGLK